MSGSVLGLLHTAAAHRSRFDAILRELAPPGVTWVHGVREDLLHDALAEVPDARQAASISTALADLRAKGAAQILCTCSSIGGLAEMVGERVQIPTLRVDRPMAERAIAAGRQILVVACLTSTLVPTAALLRDCAAAAGRQVEIETMLLPTAWRWFQDGDEAAFHRAIAAAVLDAPPAVDVVVLAQASMAPAAALLAQMQAPVFTSPRLGVEAALARLVGQHPGSMMRHSNSVHGAEGRRI